jgi:diguanylate cyclase (GGDEF)-like protein/PAS domain S-box-containing protein
MEVTRSVALVRDAPPMRVLLVEDNDDDAMLAQAAVRKAARGPAEILRADTLAKALAIVGSADVHLVLLDLNLPDSRGLDSLERMRVATRCPIIITTGENRPGLDDEALEHGAFEILHKGKLSADAIVRLLRLAEGQRRIQESLEDIEQRYRQLIEVAPDAIFVHSDWRVVLVNPAMLRLFRAERPEQLLGREVLELIAPGSREMVRARIRRLYEERQPVPLAEVEYLRADGTRFSAEVTAASFMYAGCPAAQVVARDITDRKAAERALRESEERFRSLTELSADWYWEQDEELRFSFFSPGFADRSGTTPEKRLGKRRWEEADRIPLSGTWDEHRATLEARQPFRNFEFMRVDDNGERRFQSVSGAPFYDEAGNFRGYRGASRDITERKRTEERLRDGEARFRSLSELSSDWYWEQDENFRFVAFSDSVEKHGSSRESHIGKTRWELPFLGVSEQQWAEHRATLEAHQPFRDFEYQRVTERGDTIWMSSSGMPIFDAQGRFKGYRGIGRNITERKRAEARLAHLAQFDAVTGLANRNLLGERLEQAIAQARRRSRGAGVLFIDLDNFKLVNDTLGHLAGDELLAQVGKRLKDCVRQDDTVGRLSGDEFAVVIADLSRPDDAALVAQKIIDWFAAPFDLFGQETFVTPSIGVAAFPDDGDGAGALLKCADTAMYRAKESSGNAFCFFATDMNARATSKLRLHTDLRHAIDRKEFRLHYQPKVLLASGAMTGMEALLRWEHPVRGMVSPAEFIPALEDTGLIVPVGDWVIEEARAQLRKWTLDGLQPVPIAVNLSAKQFRRRDLDKVIRALLAEQGIPPQLLELEITESCLMDDPRDAVRQLQALREAGLTISVDDFGTGYSSLAYLTRLPLSTLKIDRSFVNAAISDPGSAAIVKMVIDMSQNLRINVVAEGIETDKHVEFLRQHGCEQGQGYHFGKPMAAAAIGSRLAMRSS